MASSSSSDKSDIDLGFAEKCEPWLLTNTYFPSKIGGRPAWLNLKKLPKHDQVKCSNCGGVLAFLCQVYASLEISDDCFHRTIFVFVCKNRSCWKPNCSNNIVAFRCQLPRANKFYSFEPPSDDERLPETKVVGLICEICGCRAYYICPRCDKVAYCNTEHQMIDWNIGHKQQCSNEKDNRKARSTFLFQEFELFLDAEEDDNSQNETEEQAESRRMKEYQEFMQSRNGSDMPDVSEADLMVYAQNVEDVAFRKFIKRVARNNKQVLRYNRGGEPLWISSKNTLSEEQIPPCELCQSKRVLEFQIMPQMLNHLRAIDLDWGVINVYTCERSCSCKGYVREFVYKQDIVQESQ